jgi:hypothetical protein
MNMSIKHDNEKYALMPLDTLLNWWWRVITHLADGSAAKVMGRSDVGQAYSMSG